MMELNKHINLFDFYGSFHDRMGHWLKTINNATFPNQIVGCKDLNLVLNISEGRT
jgi:hypothetical protein